MLNLTITAKKINNKVKIILNDNDRGKNNSMVQIPEEFFKSSWVECIMEDQGPDVSFTVVDQYGEIVYGGDVFDTLCCVMEMQKKEKIENLTAQIKRLTTARDELEAGDEKSLRVSEKMKKCSVDELYFIIKDCNEAFEAGAYHNPEAGKYLDELSLATEELKRRRSIGSIK